jgi:hypothetical protein
MMQGASFAAASKTSKPHLNRTQAAPANIRSEPGHVAVMSPHRAQCAALQSTLLAAAPPPRNSGGGGGSGSGGAEEGAGGGRGRGWGRRGRGRGRGRGREAAGGASSDGEAASAGGTGGGGGYSGFFKMIDTVEKLQGQEAPVVIYSATASCPAAIAANADFYSSLNRANVALSRARRRLVVVVSSAMLSMVPGSLGQYRDLTLFKQLRGACGRELGAARVRGAEVRVFGAA